MKKFIIAAIAATIATTPVLAAPRDNHSNNRGKIEQSHRQVTKKVVVVKQNNRQAQKQYRKWMKGQRFDSRYAQNYRVVSNPRQYRLNTAPRGYRWVQSGNDAVLVGITSGLIASVLAGVIR